MPQPTPSNIIFEFIEGDSDELPGLEINECLYTGESADLEIEGIGSDGVLDFILSDQEVDRTSVGPGWYIAIGFEAFYTKSYEGEVDADYSVKEFRPALPEDHAQFYYQEGADMYFNDFVDAIETIRTDLRFAGKEVRTETWQGVKANTDTLELFDVNFKVDLQGIEDLDHWARNIGPSLPWADDHFLERIGGEPLNPGVQWAKWPWGQSARNFKAERFNHSYMERLWPRYARRTPDGKLPQGPVADGLRRHPASDYRPKQGIGWNYGDLQDLIELLVAQPHTRQAWIPLFFPEDTGIGDGGRKPCTLGYQILVREGQAHIWYPLRSCDFIRHFRDDCYLAVRLLLWIIQECRKRSDQWQSIVPGTYSMHMTSLHIFESDKPTLEGMVVLK